MVLNTLEYVNRMWSNKLHRVEVRSHWIRNDGAVCLAGMLVADTPDALKLDWPMPDVPFRVTLPAGLDEGGFHWAMTVMYNRQQAGQSLMDLDFVPRPISPPDVPSTNWRGVCAFVAVALFGSAAIGALCERR